MRRGKMIDAYSNGSIYTIVRIDSVRYLVDPKLLDENAIHSMIGRDVVFGVSRTDDPGSQEIEWIRHA